MARSPIRRGRCGTKPEARLEAIDDLALDGLLEESFDSQHEVLLFDRDQRDGGA